MLWVFILVGLAVIGVFALAATGALGQLEETDEFENQNPHLKGERIPLALFGYRKSRVDRVISDLENEIETLKQTKIKSSRK